MFQTRNGTPFCKSNVRRKLGQIFEEIQSANSRAARLPSWPRLRAASKRRSGRSGKRDLVKEWIGYSNLRITSGYTHFQDDFRTRIARKEGLFEQEMWQKNCQLVPIVPILTHLR